MARRCVVAHARRSRTQTCAVAKTASRALDLRPYLQLRNLADSIQELQKLGYLVLGLDGEATETIDTVYAVHQDRAIALVLGAEGPGLRKRTKETVDQLVRIEFAGEFGSLNVSNAAAVALYAVTR